MQITCPHCGFSKEIDAAQLPADITKVNCPKCKQSFPLPERVEDATFTQEQPFRERQPDPAQTAILTRREITALPKAGFWMRVVATFIDTFIVFALQFLLGTLLAVVGIANNSGSAGDMALLVQLFGFALSCTYYVFFTGYCGQTPGKMVLRIKVIRCDGSSLSYGRAAFREIPAKFISGIIFGIGYLMVAFDEQKQGLHDRMADTYVIKL
jgi:predicted Zn finger-like uncharacterized protein